MDTIQPARHMARNSFRVLSIFCALWGVVMFYGGNVAAACGFVCSSLLATVVRSVLDPAGMDALLRWFAPRKGGQQ